jgi:hypothetical protein
VELIAAGEAFHGLDLVTVRLDREHEAGAHRLPVQQDGTGAAHAVLAAHVRAREPEIMAQKVGKEEPSVDALFVPAPVHHYRDGMHGRQ